MQKDFLTITPDSGGGGEKGRAGKGGGKLWVGGKSNNNN